MEESTPFLPCNFTVLYLTYVVVQVHYYNRKRSPFIHPYSLSFPFLSSLTRQARYTQAPPPPRQCPTVIFSSKHLGLFQDFSFLGRKGGRFEFPLFFYFLGEAKGERESGARCRHTSLRRRKDGGRMRGMMMMGLVWAGRMVMGMCSFYQS